VFERNKSGIFCQYKLVIGLYITNSSFKQITIIL